MCDVFAGLCNIVLTLNRLKARHYINVAPSALTVTEYRHMTIHLACIFPITAQKRNGPNACKETKNELACTENKGKIELSAHHLH